MKIQICGVFILKGNNQLIYVIDGVIFDNLILGNIIMDWDVGNNNVNDYGNELKNFNLDDFEIVLVLKGVVVIVFYGLCGLNGVVVIIIKLGKGFKGFGVFVL